MKRPCIVCSTPTEATRCPRCAATHTPPNWPAISTAVIERDNHRCQLQLHCCTKRATTADHINPWLPPTPDNLQAACRPCNAAKR